MGTGCEEQGCDNLGSQSFRAASKEGVTDMAGLNYLYVLEENVSKYYRYTVRSKRVATH